MNDIEGSGITEMLERISLQLYIANQLRIADMVMSYSMGQTIKGRQTMLDMLNSISQGKNYFDLINKKG